MGKHAKPLLSDLAGAFWYTVTHFVLRNAVCAEIDQLAQLFLGHAAVLADALDFLSDVHFNSLSLQDFPHCTTS